MIITTTRIRPKNKNKNKNKNKKENKKENKNYLSNLNQRKLPTIIIYNHLII